MCKAEGEGSASADNEERDAFFKKQGFTVLHFPNSIIESEHANILCRLVTLEHATDPVPREHTLMIRKDGSIVYNGSKLIEDRFLINGHAIIRVRKEEEGENGG